MNMIYLVVKGDYVEDKTVVASFSKLDDANHFVSLAGEAFKDNLYVESLFANPTAIPLDIDLTLFEQGWRWWSVAMNSLSGFIDIKVEAVIHPSLCSEYVNKRKKQWIFRQCIWAPSEEEAKKQVNHNFELRIKDPKFGKVEQ